MPAVLNQIMCPICVEVDAPQELRWVGSLAIPYLFQGEHIFKLESISANQTKLLHNEKMWGLLVPLVGGLLQKTEQGFNDMNKALKERVESA